MPHEIPRVGRSAERADVHEALAAAVLHYPRWSRQDLGPAQVLAAYGREQVTPHWPDELAELDTVNDDLIRAIGDSGRRWYNDEVTSEDRRPSAHCV